MIIDFRMRPPARGFLNIGVYDDVARTAKLTECFSMKQAPSVAQKSPELMLQENGHRRGDDGRHPGPQRPLQGVHLQTTTSSACWVIFPGRFRGHGRAQTPPKRERVAGRKSTAPC